MFGISQMYEHGREGGEEEKEGVTDPFVFDVVLRGLKTTWSRFLIV